MSNLNNKDNKSNRFLNRGKAALAHVNMPKRERRDEEA
jgi:hypothetical protein